MYDENRKTSWNSSSSFHKACLWREAIQVKDAVLFAAQHKEELIQALQIDTYEPPMTQGYSVFHCAELLIKRLHNESSLLSQPKVLWTFVEPMIEVYMVTGISPIDSMETNSDITVEISDLLVLLTVRQGIKKIQILSFVVTDGLLNLTMNLGMLILT